MRDIIYNSFIVLSLATIIFLSCCSLLTGPSNIRVENPQQAVSDARRLIEESRKLDKELEPYPKYIPVSELPESLRISGLEFAHVYEDHLELVLARNPDWKLGVRIWSTDLTRQHADQKTKYADIYFFNYNKELPEAPDNIP